MSETPEVLGQDHPFTRQADYVIACALGWAHRGMRPGSSAERNFMKAIRDLHREARKAFPEVDWSKAKITGAPED